jgi:type III secretion system YopN/LcrE/InvE/MxiC family regulator
MANNLRISGQVAVGPAHAEAQAQAGNAKGSWRGQTLALAPAGAAKVGLQAHEASMQGLPAVQVRNLASRRVLVETNFRRLAPADIFQRAQTLGADSRSVRAGARAAMAGKPPPASGGRQASAARYMSLQLAAASLEDDVSESEATAMLTPVRSQQHTPQDLSELLRHAANDGDEFERFLEDILAGLDTTAQDGEELASKLKQARNDDGKLMDLLRSAQKIPALHQEQTRTERQILRQQIQDEIREFERSNDGALVLASFNAAPVAARTAEPASFLQTYTELVTVPRTFAAALKLLLSRYPMEGIEGILDDLKKALGDDLGAATPSQDSIRLGAVLADLGNMAMSTSLIESVKELIGLLQRVEEKRKQDERRRKKDGREEEDEAEENEVNAARSNVLGS